MLDLKITKQRIKDHLYYSKWAYIATIAGALIFFSLIFSITKPKVPDEFKIDITVLGLSMQETEKTQWEQEILATLSEDQQEVNIFTLGLTSSEDSTDYTLYEVLAARMAAKEDDILILPKNVYLSYAAQGAFSPLDDIALGYEFPEGTDFDELKVATEDDTQSYLYGIPISHVLGFADLGIDPTDKVLTVLVYTENYDNALKAADYIMSRTESILLSEMQEETSEE